MVSFPDKLRIAQEKAALHIDDVTRYKKAWKTITKVTAGKDTI